LERMTRPRRTAGPGPARVLVHPSETWSHPRGTLGRCLKGSEIHIILLVFNVKVKENLWFIAFYQKKRSPAPSFPPLTAARWWGTASGGKTGNGWSDPTRLSTTGRKRITPSSSGASGTPSGPAGLSAGPFWTGS